MNMNTKGYILTPKKGYKLQSHNSFQMFSTYLLFPSTLVSIGLSLPETATTVTVTARPTQRSDSYKYKPFSQQLNIFHG